MFVFLWVTTVLCIMKQDPHITPTGWLYEIGPWFTDEESQKKDLFG